LRRPADEQYDAMVRKGFEVVSDTLPRLPVKVLGLRMTNGAYGFGLVVLRRRPHHATVTKPKEFS
jgi:hypothetical protein